MKQWIKDMIYVRKTQNKLMNQDERSYQLPHIYNCLLSVAATPGEQSLQRRRLPKR